MKLAEVVEGGVGVEVRQEGGIGPVDVFGEFAFVVRLSSPLRLHVNDGPRHRSVNFAIKLQ